MARYPKPPSGSLSGRDDFEFIEIGRGRLGYNMETDEDPPEGSLMAWRANRGLESKGGA